jgi:hypothetical protein
LDTASDAAKKANNTALSTQIQSALDARKALFDILTANYQNDEDGIQMQGALREDIQTAFFVAQNVPTKPGDQFVGRVTAELRDAVAKYNAYVTGVLPVVNSALKAVSMKPLEPIAPEYMP